MTRQLMISVEKPAKKNVTNYAKVLIKPGIRKFSCGFPL